MYKIRKSYSRNRELWHSRTRKIGHLTDSPISDNNQHVIKKLSGNSVSTFILYFNYKMFALIMYNILESKISVVTIITY